MTNDIDYLIEVSEDVYFREAKLGFAHLSEPEQVFYCVWTLHCEVFNDGFDGFYFNSGEHAIKTIDALETIGASHSAEILRRANAVFGPTGPSTDRSDRQNQLLHSLPDSAEDTLNILTEQFYEKEVDRADLLKSYVVAHKKEFQSAF